MIGDGVGKRERGWGWEKRGRGGSGEKRKGEGVREEGEDKKWPGEKEEGREGRGERGERGGGPGVRKEVEGTKINSDRKRETVITFESFSRVSEQRDEGSLQWLVQLFPFKYTFLFFLP